MTNQKPLPPPKPPSKKPTPETPKAPYIPDPVLRALTREYFLLLRTEESKGKCPKATADADHLEKVIKKYKQDHQYDQQG